MKFVINPTFPVNLLADGIQLLDRGQHAVGILLHVINTVEDILTSNLNIHLLWKIHIIVQNVTYIMSYSCISLNIKTKYMEHVGIKDFD